MLAGFTKSLCGRTHKAGSTRMTQAKYKRMPNKNPIASRRYATETKSTPEDDDIFGKALGEGTDRIMGRID
mgnify:CR=1 FL=1